MLNLIMGNRENFETLKNTVVVAPVVTVDDYTVNDDDKLLTIHSHITLDHKMLLNKREAALLLVELYKFIQK